ncbi:CapA family protein [Brevibacillus invocatus]
MKSMKRKITIAAVGDLLMWKNQVASAYVPGTKRFSFSEQFSPVLPLLKGADFTIGNLETTFSGKKQPYQIGSARTGYPRFNCPDELAADLKQAGFDFLTTANNHCLDGGPNGLRRTLDVLDHYNLGHTGTYRTKQESIEPFIREVNGFRIGVLAYTYGTNKQTLPSDVSWMVNRIHAANMKDQVLKLRPHVDLLIVSLHFGVEFRFEPTLKQRLLVQSILECGADIILGAHPHVLQPVTTPMIARDNNGLLRKTVVAYSLGNFTSERMLEINQTQCGAILYLTVEMDTANQTSITQISMIPTYCQPFLHNGRKSFRVVPLLYYLRNPDQHLTPALRQKLQLMWGRVTQIVDKRFL